MWIFSNFIVVFILMGLFTRLVKHFVKKRFDRQMVPYITFGIAFIIFGTLAALFLGFDVAISEYVVVLLVYLFYDLNKE